MTTNKPFLSIGLPVYNGDNYLEQALDSLVNQTFSDFELIISDNGSTDRTEEICRTYAARDERIRYYRNEENLGATKNFNRTFELSSGKYFKWAAHDDVLVPEFLERCIEVLERDDSVVLCHCKTNIIDQYGKPYLHYLVELNTDSPRPHERFHAMVSIEHWCFQSFGVVRAEALKKTPLIQSFSGSDKNLLAELCLMGKIYEIPEALFLRREHPEASTNAFPGERERGLWFDPTLAGQIHIPIWLKFSNYFKSINRVPLSPYDRLMCYFQLARWVGEKIFLRFARRFKYKADRSHIAVPVEGAEWR